MNGTFNFLQYQNRVSLYGTSRPNSLGKMKKLEHHIVFGSNILTDTGCLSIQWIDRYNMK